MQSGPADIIIEKHFLKVLEEEMTHKTTLLLTVIRHFEEDGTGFLKDETVPKDEKEKLMTVHSRAFIKAICDLTEAHSHLMDRYARMFCEKKKDEPLNPKPPSKNATRFFIDEPEPTNIDE